MADATRAGSVMGASATKKTPSSNSSKSSAATCKPRRVLPMPPGPVRVSRRTSSSRKRPRTSLSSRSRPTSGVGWAGRLFILASRVFKGGKLVGNPGESSLEDPLGTEEVLQAPLAQVPQGRPFRKTSRVSSLVACEKQDLPAVAGREQPALPCSQAGRSSRRPARRRIQCAAPSVTRNGTDSSAHSS